MVGFIIYMMVLRSPDHFHVVRQSFGILQIFARSSGLSLPGWMHNTANWFFLALFALQMLTFWNGMEQGNAAKGSYQAGDPLAVNGYCGSGFRRDSLRQAGCRCRAS